MKNGLKKIGRLGAALSVVGLLGACQMTVTHYPAGGTGPIHVAGPQPDLIVRHTPRSEIDNLQIDQRAFGTVDPRPGRTGSADPAQAAVEKLEAARSAQYFEPWMASVTRANRAADRGIGQVLTLGIDVRDPSRAARDMVNTYNRLADMVWSSNIGERQGNILQLSRAYRATLRQRQNTAMLLQAQPDMQTMVQYVELEAARRVLGKVLRETGVLAGGDYRNDYASTFGMLSGTGLDLQDARQGRFGLDEVQLTNDRAQRGSSISSVGRVEAQYMQEVASTLRYDIQFFNQQQQRAAVRDEPVPRRFGG